MLDKEKKWIKLIQKKADEKAANALVSFYYQPIYSFVYKQTLNKELSLDLTQDIFIGMLQSIHNFDMEKASFKTWLYKIATYRVIDYFRSKYYRYDKVVGPIEELEIPENYDFTIELEFKDVIEKITAFINELDAFSQQIIRLKLFTENTFTEIANMLDRPESTVKTRYYAVMKKLKDRMEV